MVQQLESRIMVQKFSLVQCADGSNLNPEQVIKVAAVKAFGNNVNIITLNNIVELYSGAHMKEFQKDKKNIIYIKGEDTTPYFSVHSIGQEHEPETFLNKEELTKLMIFIQAVIEGRLKIYLIQDNVTNFELTANVLGKANINYYTYEFGSSHIFTILVTDTVGDIKVKQGIKYDSKTTMLFHIINQYFDIILSEEYIDETDKEKKTRILPRGGFYLSFSDSENDPKAPTVLIECVEDILEFVNKYYNTIKYKGLTEQKNLVIN